MHIYMYVYIYMYKFKSFGWCRPRPRINIKDEKYQAVPCSSFVLVAFWACGDGGVEEFI